MFLNTTNANGRSHSHFVTAFIIFTENPLVNVYLSSKGLFLLPFAAPLKVSAETPAETFSGAANGNLFFYSAVIYVSSFSNLLL